MPHPVELQKKIGYRSNVFFDCSGSRIDFLPAGSAAGSSAGIVFIHGPIFGFFAPQERLVAPIKVEFGRVLPAKFHLDRSRGGGLRPPKLKKIEFYQYNCP